MTASTLPRTSGSESGTGAPARSTRFTSVDALRGLVMFTMIFVNDIAGVPEEIVPGWMKHYRGVSGMTFVDLVFPAFLFIVGMSIPVALGPRLSRGEPLWRIFSHVLVRTFALLFIGILMVNGTPDSEMMGWSGTLWSVLMYLAAIIACCSLALPVRSESQPTRAKEGASDTQSGARSSRKRALSLILRTIGWVGLLCLAFAFRGKDGHRIISLSPFSIRTQWYGILGLIGWAYLVGSIVFVVFRTNRTALLGSAVLLMCFYPAQRTGAFDHFWLAHYVNLGAAIGSHGAITVAGLLLGTSLVSAEFKTVWARARFTLLFIAGCAAAALLLYGLYGINKNSATPSWCLWACAITATFWLVFHFIADGLPGGGFAKPLALAGQNVFLAYLISCVLPSLLDLLHLDNWYGNLAQPELVPAVARSAGCAAVILCATVGLNRLGFRLKL